MPRSITPEFLATHRGSFVVVDVRKEPARTASGRTIAGCLRWAPDELSMVPTDIAGRRVAVFCVHGHEVSQAACQTLTDSGVDTVFLAGGFEAWNDAGYDVAPVELVG